MQIVINLNSLLMLLGIVYGVGFAITGIYQWMSFSYNVSSVVKFRRSMLWFVYFIATFVDMGVGKK